jgi:predicted TIM-barrel fold metal-dependent hydrolase
MTLLYLDRINWWEGNPECLGTPEEYFKKIYYDVAGPVRSPAIRFVYDTVGPDQMLFGGDYPHGREGRDDQFYPMTLQAMAELDVPQEDKDKIYHKTAQRIFGF